MSGQYAEQQKGDMEHMAAVPSQDGANATPSGTRFDLSNVTAEDVKAFVSSLYRQETPWALGCAAVMTSIWGDREVLKEASEKAASALTTLTQQNLLLHEANSAFAIHLREANARANQMGDTTVPVANGGASTTASGTHSPEPWHTGGVFSFDGPEDDELDIYGPFPEGKSSGPLIVGHVPIANARRIVACVNACAGASTADLEDGTAVVIVKNKLDRTAPETSTRSADE